MVFSSITFLFFFLPSVLLLYLLAGTNGRNLLLLMASLFFYAWGEGVYLVLMLVSIGINYTGGRIIATSGTVLRKKWWLATTVILNLLLLGYFKYATFVAENINSVLSSYDCAIDLAPIRLPIGISFFTFQALSYIIDVYREKVTPQKSLLRLALYISLFPQLIAGPIVRYQDIAEQISVRRMAVATLAAGIQRFIFGLSKKILIANPMAAVADRIFSLPENELTTSLAWLGAVCYTVQIYFDFSGYSDMAIGLGRMFGFHFLENFHYPYVSKSIREFWRRWHMSLSSWFRDYVYIPLGGNRKGRIRTGVNLITVFFLCGLWHGAAWTFIVWGLYHGFFLLLERTAVGSLLEKLWVPLRIAMTLLIIILGWVIFRSETLPQALTYIGIMFGSQSDQVAAIPELLNKKEQFELCCGLFFSLPVLSWLREKRIKERISTRYFHAVDAAGNLCKLAVMVLLLYFSVISLAAGVYNPFIYFRF
ncbi:MAG: membrane-bound O-acyltransferase family protein [Proteobacteria bacterium]|nr:MAG: membrane-bound O-acyltransferase family protein [Pseudomonadota bacterium]